MIAKFRQSKLWAKIKQGADDNKDLVLAIGLLSSATINILNEVGFFGEIVGTSMQPTFNKQSPDTWSHNQIYNHTATKETDSNLFLSSCKTTLALLSSWMPVRLRQYFYDDLKYNIKVTHDRVLFNKWSVRDKTKICIGDVVILISPRRPETRLIKRVIALPGDELYIISEARTIIIDPGHCWVESDNQLPLHVQREDSNLFGQIPLGLIIARASYVVWPPKNIGVVKSDDMAPYKSLRTQPI